MITIHDVLPRLEKVTSVGDGQWKARCPAHEDKNPSLSVSIGDDGKAIWKCHAGCSQDAVLEALHLDKTPVDPLPKKAESRAAEPKAYLTKADATAAAHARFADSTVTTYDYSDTFSMVRFDMPRAKNVCEKAPLCRYLRAWKGFLTPQT